MTIYLDHNATTPLRPEAAEAVADAMHEAGNPSSIHGAGRKARRVIEDAREQVAALVNVQADDVIFTSGGTEANNLAVAQGTGEILVSAVEHASILDAMPNATRIAVDGDGVVDLQALDDLLVQATAHTPGEVLVSVMLANNETGVIQPIDAVVETARRHGARVHCDAVQAAGKQMVDFTAMGLDMLSLSAHKIGGPAGVGALIVAPGTEIRSILRGGGQERSRRAGTENIAGVAGFGAAASWAQSELQGMVGMSKLRDHLESRITQVVPEVTVFGKNRDRLPTTSCLTMPGVSAETQVMAFDLAGIAVSAGAACSSGKVAASHVLAAMGTPEDSLMSAIRVSLGWTTECTDVDEFIEAWKSLYARLGQSSLAA